jgi:heme-degrading monooxygenase HmoA
VIEIVTFRVVGDEAEFMALDSRIQTEFTYQQPGLGRRTTARNADGEWIVITLWSSGEAADAAQAAWTAHPLHAEFAAQTATKSMLERRYESLPG